MDQKNLINKFIDEKMTDNDNQSDFFEQNASEKVDKRPQLPPKRPNSQNKLNDSNMKKLPSKDAQENISNVLKKDNINSKDEGIYISTQQKHRNILGEKYHAKPVNSYNYEINCNKTKKKSFSIDNEKENSSKEKKTKAQKMILIYTILIPSLIVIGMLIFCAFYFNWFKKDKKLIINCFELNDGCYLKVDGEVGYGYLIDADNVTIKCSDSLINLSNYLFPGSYAIKVASIKKNGEISNNYSESKQVLVKGLKEFCKPTFIENKICWESWQNAKEYCVYVDGKFVCKTSLNEFDVSDLTCGYHDVCIKYVSASNLYFDFTTQSTRINVGGRYEQLSGAYDIKLAVVTVYDAQSPKVRIVLNDGKFVFTEDCKGSVVVIDVYKKSGISSSDIKKVEIVAVGEELMPSEATTIYEKED